MIRTPYPWWRGDAYVEPNHTSRARTGDGCDCYGRAWEQPQQTASVCGQWFGGGVRTFYEDEGDSE